ncbi:HAMP domain-containing protein [bacterium]|nr:HAMP domain-containing protein [bacterium]
MNDAKKRKIYFIKPGFQKKMMILMVLLVAIAVNLVGGLCFGLITTTLEDELLSQSGFLGSMDPSQISLLKTRLFEYLFPRILIAEAITILVLSFLTLRLTHHIAGPVYRLESNLKKMAAGDFSLKTTFRDGDEFKELADALNDFSDAICEQQEVQKSKISQLQATDLSKEQSQLLQEIESSYGLPV